MRERHSFTTVRARWCVHGMPLTGTHIAVGWTTRPDRNGTYDRRVTLGGHYAWTPSVVVLAVARERVPEKTDGYLAAVQRCALVVDEPVGE